MSARRPGPAISTLVKIISKQPPELALLHAPVSVHDHQRHQQQEENRQAGETRQYAGQNQQRTQHFGEDRHAQGQAGTQMERVFDQRQLRLEIKQLGQAVDEQQE